MRDLHPELDIDVEALEHIKLGFLREPCDNLARLLFILKQEQKPPQDPIRRQAWDKSDSNI